MEVFAVRSLIGCALVFVLSLPTRAQTLGFALANGKSRVEFPIEVINNLVVLPVIINGQLPLKFILDTGVRTAILTEKAYTDILNLSYSRHYMISGPGGEKLIDAYITNNVTLDIPPGVHGEGHAMLVLEKDYLELRNFLGIDVHGVLGYELFSRFMVEVDYERKTLTLSRPHRFRKARKYEVLPITIEDTKPYVRARVHLNDSTFFTGKFLVDSGASHGLYVDKDSNDTIQLPPKRIHSIIGRGLGGVITGEIGRIKSITLGNFNIGDLIANFPDANSYYDTLKAARDVFRNGSIGGELLSRFNVVFDFPGERLYLRRNAQYKREFYYNMSGLTVRAKGSQLKRFEVDEVRENSTAARADIQRGDIVLSVQGFKAADLTLAEINSLFSSKPGKKIKLEIYRAGATLRREFLLESPI
ncbi:MAG: aspartyl protease family protein [Cyclobacteriaceae bacterium]|nr:aspartyl protease family protein [Cyclobacteriaceae bacterium]